MGENKSRMRVDMLSGVVLSFSFSSGKRGVRYSNATRSRISSVVLPFTLSTFNKAKYFSPSLGGRICPRTVSPVLFEIGSVFLHGRPFLFGLLDVGFKFRGSTFGRFIKAGNIAFHIDIDR